MCFGGKADKNDDPAPRPAQQQPSHQWYQQHQEQNHHQDVKSSAPYDPYNGNGGSSSASANQYRQQTYAPPSGPPPSQQQTGYAPPSGPPPSHQQNQYAPPPGPPPSQYQQQDFSAPPGPPPSHQQHEYAPPSGPPPSHGQGDYAPPPGPPPAQRDDFAPPPGPPPQHHDWAAPPPEPPTHANAQHDWERAVPDTSLFPPPPAIFSGYDASPANNASEEEAIAGEDWCQQYPMTMPMDLDPAAKQALAAYNLRLMEPVGFNGSLNWLTTGHWEGSTNKNSPDRCIIGYPPLYLVKDHDPTRYGQPKTIYYEVKLRSDSKNNFIAMGFTALPYPSFRLPGWHRGSVGVHGDDGHKYINDRWGGKDFTHEFRKGETLGIGMTLKPTGTQKPEVTIFFTRNGARAGEWNLHEETDAEQDLPVTGLEGFHDLSCAIGTFDSVKFEVIFDPNKLLYRP